MTSEVYVTTAHGQASSNVNNNNNDANQPKGVWSSVKKGMRGNVALITKRICCIVAGKNEF